MEPVIAALKTVIAMKTKLLLLAAAALAVASFNLDLKAQQSAPTASEVRFPYGKECIITLDPKAWPQGTVNSPNKASGLQEDWTLRGQLIYLSEDWCVLKDGTFENWIPKDKVLLMRASK